VWWRGRGRSATHVARQVEGCHRRLELVELVAVLNGGERVGGALRQVAEVLGLGAARYLEQQRIRQLAVQLGRRQQLRAQRGTHARQQAASPAAAQAQAQALGSRCTPNGDRSLRARLVENVIGALPRVQHDDARLLQQVRLDDGALDLARAPEDDLDPLAIARRVVVANRLGVAKRLQDLAAQAPRPGSARAEAACRPRAHGRRTVCAQMHWSSSGVSLSFLVGCTLLDISAGGRRARQRRLAAARRAQQRGSTRP
jgi:hypothetical protein